MDKDLEKLSALYDGELSYKEIQEGLIICMKSQI